MNWIAFLIGGWIVFGLELGLRDAIELGEVGASPSFVIVYLVVVSLMAARHSALWGALLLGLMLDLTQSHPTPDGVGSVVTIGPYALGCLLASYAVVTVRALVIKGNWLTTPMLCLVAASLMHIVVVAIFTARSWYDPLVEFQPIRELGSRVLSALYTAAIAVLLGPVLLYLAPLFRFQAADTRTRFRRA
jgi:hypothetical protein